MPPSSVSADSWAGVSWLGESPSLSLSLSLRLVMNETFDWSDLRREPGWGANGTPYQQDGGHPTFLWPFPREKAGFQSSDAPRNVGSGTRRTPKRTATVS